jgi:hypothetical protein
MSFDRLIKEQWEGLGSFGVIAVQLVPDGKVTTHGWSHFLDLHDQRGQTRLDLVERWLDEGYGVGYLPRGGLYAIDCDVPKGMSVPPMQERLEDFFVSTGKLCPRVTTPSGGAHFLAQLPPDLSRDHLKNHICHPTINGERQPWDWKLYHRTLMVGPGTVREKDGILRTYEPATRWTEPPIIHPHWIEPGLDLYLPESQPFLRCDRPLQNRIVGAVCYLKTKAPVSVDGKGGKKTLNLVAAHLVAYYDLDPALALWLLTNPEVPGGCWNARCKGDGGKPYPWTKGELYDALEQAVDAVPIYGRDLYQQLRRRVERENDYDAFMDVLGHLPPPAPGPEAWMFGGDLIVEFQRINNLDPARFDPITFGRKLNAAIASGRVRLERKLKGKARLAAYLGVDAHLLAQAVVRHRGSAQELLVVS